MNFEENELSGHTVDLIDALLTSMHTEPMVEVSEDELVRFAFGWANDEEIEGVLTALNQSPELRQQLIQVRGSLNTAHARSEQVNGFLEHAVNVAVAAFSSLEKGLAAWKADFESELVVRHSLKALADRSRTSPSRLAFSRSQTCLAELEFNEATSKFSAEVTKDGCLEIWGELHPDHWADGKEVRLEIVDEVLGSIPVGSAPLIDGKWKVVVREFGPWDAGVLPANKFRLQFVDELPKPEFGDLVARTEDGTLVLIPLLTPPIMGSGLLRLQIQCDEAFRTRYGRLVLHLSFNAGPLTIPLRAWEVADLPSDGQLIAPIPSSLEGPLPKAALALSMRRIALYQT